MKVYVIMADYGYEGHNYVATFATKELAKKQIKILKEGDFNTPDDFKIIETEVLNTVDPKLVDNYKY